jgi:hypothetical protein
VFGGGRLGCHMWAPVLKIVYTGDGRDGMAKHARAVVEEPDMRTRTVVSEEAMEKRKRLAALVRARMDKPATATEKRLWQELKAEVAKERLTFRS